MKRDYFLISRMIDNTWTHTNTLDRENTEILRTVLF